MNTMWKLGSYISKGVCTVAGPFHPFGGAIDIIVVEQPDGSFKSSPWYVRFGKFQGFLTVKENVVDVSVNGVDATFQMYLDHRGEAYFLRKLECDDEAGSLLPFSPSGDEIDMKSLKTPRPMKSKGCKLLDEGKNVKKMERSTSRRSKLIGFVFGRRSKSEGNNLEELTRCSVATSMSPLERAEIAADLLEVKWSTNLATSRSRKSSAQKLDVSSQLCSNMRADYSAVDSSASIVGNGSADEGTSATEIKLSLPETTISSCQLEQEKIVEKKMINKICSISRYDHLDDGTTGVYPLFGNRILTSPLEKTVKESQQVQWSPDGDSLSDNSDESKLTLPDELGFSQVERCPEVFNDRDVTSVPSLPCCESALSHRNILQDDCELHGNPIEMNLRHIPYIVFENRGDAKSEERSLKMSVPDSSSNITILERDLSKLVNHSHHVNKKEKRDVQSLTIEGSISTSANSMISSGSAYISISESRNNDSGHSSGVDTKLQPETTNPKLSSTSNLTSNQENIEDMFNRRIVRVITPTSEQLKSLNLREGRNTVTFTFSTPVLGEQKVDARIFLWKWNAQIVISDVDGTITKSDVLGQFMPLLGADWSQTGVANLFSAIKENGYQFMFLSARAISQAYHTRRLLFNINQKGQTLPDGPVVISPDGLFPSLFREIIWRVPHEFKIACLQDIKALFPSDCHPFYAGFGNRDTDEISYLNVGVPKGKIFIINPKGQVAVNKCVDTRSYHSLHDLVHGMFPSMLSSEQEDYNAWNFWKLPLPFVEV